MVSQEEALNQIQDIKNIVQRSLSVIVPGSLFMLTGLGITLIPLTELGFKTFLDPLLSMYGLGIIGMFLLRTIFYWSSFWAIGYFFGTSQALHPAIRKAWALNSIFPLIPVATGGMLGLCGYGKLATPIVLILIGCLFSLVGRFTHRAISGMAITYIIAGIGSIYLTTTPLAPSLWMYLLIFQGLVCFITGFILHRAHHA